MNGIVNYSEVLMELSSSRLHIAVMMAKNSSFHSQQSAPLSLKRSTETVRIMKGILCTNNLLECVAPCCSVWMNLWPILYILLLPNRNNKSSHSNNWTRSSTHLMVQDLHQFFCFAFSRAFFSVQLLSKKGRMVPRRDTDHLILPAEKNQTKY